MGGINHLQMVGLLLGLPHGLYPDCLSRMPCPAAIAVCGGPSCWNWEGKRPRQWKKHCTIWDTWKWSQSFAETWLNQNNWIETSYQIDTKGNNPNKSQGIWHKWVSHAFLWDKLRRMEKLRRADKRRAQMSWEEMRKAQMTWEDMRWEQLRKGEKTWDEMRWGEKRWEDTTWDEMRWDDTDCSDKGMQWAMSKRSCDAMRSDYIGEKRSNLGTRWHWKEKSRDCCCKAPKACQKPIGTEMALQKIRQTEMMTWETENDWDQLRRAVVGWEEERRRERTWDEMTWKKRRKHCMRWDEMREDEMWDEMRLGAMG